MAQDLTPQLRTRLNRVERVVGIFVGVAVILMLTGLGYFLHHTAERKGWFLKKVPYFTFVIDAAGLKVGDPVKLMGFNVGEITLIETMPPESTYNVYVQFRIREPYYGYIWKTSKVKINQADFLGNRFLEVTKGVSGAPTVLETNWVSFGKKHSEILGILVDEQGKPARYDPLTSQSKGYFLPPDEAPALNDRLDGLLTKVEDAIPEILKLTNDIHRVLVNASDLTEQLNDAVGVARPVLTNLHTITDHLTEPEGSLGKWLLPSDLKLSLNDTLDRARTTMHNTDTNLTSLTVNVNRSLDNLAEITGQLRKQLDANTNILQSISQAVVHADEFVQGLKKHWLLRRAFRETADRPPHRESPKKAGSKEGKR